MKKPVTWREALIIASENARMRCHHAAPWPSGPSDPETIAHHRGQQLAYSTMADDLLYIATLGPHEGLAELRKLSRRPK